MLTLLHLIVIIRAITICYIIFHKLFTYKNELKQSYHILDTVYIVLLPPLLLLFLYKNYNDTECQQGEKMSKSMSILNVTGALSSNQSVTNYCHLDQDIT